MARICIDAGHGGNDPGAVYNGREESDDTLALAKAVAAELRRHGVIVDETRTADITVSLNERCNFENRQSYDYFISLHRNAFKPEQAKGVETYTYLNPGTKAKGLANKIQTALVDVGFTNRGVKRANFHVLREAKAPAVLVEVGFIDHTGDNQLFDGKRVEIVRAITGAILEQLGIKYVPPVKTWKENIIEDAMQVGLITEKHDPDEAVTKWFVLAVGLNLLKNLGK